MILFGRHAREQMALRGIEEKQIKEAIKRGSKHIQKPDKIVADYQYFSVVYKKSNNTIFIITVKTRW